jgi:hypothetical protein
VQPVVYSEQLESGEPIASQEQAACAKFTEDNHVFAVNNTNGLGTSGIYDCLAAHNVFQMLTAPTFTSTLEFQKYPTSLVSLAASIERNYVALADHLNQVGYFKDPGMKLGMVVQNFDWYRSGAAAFIKRIASYNVKPAQVIYICSGNTSGDIGDASNTQASCSTAEENNAVLKMQTAGVNHVVVLRATGFIQQATSDHYNPRYALTTDEGTSLSSGPEYNGAVGIGWYPDYDIHWSANKPRNPAEQLCYNILSARGAAPNNQLAEATAYPICEGFFLLKSFVDTAGTVSVAATNSAMDRVGTRYLPIGTFTTDYGPSRRDGANTYRGLQYNSSSGFFEYTADPPQPMPQQW